MSRYKILFANLDGTLIDTISKETFPKGIWDMKIKFEVLDKIKELKPDFLFIVSNQGGIEKGFVKEQHFCLKLSFIVRSIKEYCNVSVDYYYCSSNNKDDRDRKPNCGMLQKAISDYYDYYDINFMWDKSEMLMIGDASGKLGQFSDSDKKTAENFGIDYLDVEDFIQADFNKYVEHFDND